CAWSSVAAVNSPSAAAHGMSGLIACLIIDLPRACLTGFGGAPRCGSMTGRKLSHRPQQVHLIEGYDCTRVLVHYDSEPEQPPLETVVAPSVRCAENGLPSSTSNLPVRRCAPMPFTMPTSCHFEEMLPRKRAFLMRGCLR